MICRWVSISRFSLLAVAFATVACCFPAYLQAGSLSSTSRALNDGFGPDAGQWRGSASIAVPPVAPPLFNDRVTAVVEWAAFAPGDFQLYLNDEGIAASDPSGPSEVLYAYQIVSIDAAIPGISTLTVAVDTTDARGSVLAPTEVATGAASEVANSGGGDQSTSMAWFFDSLLQPGDTTALLVFTSPFAPILDNLQLSSGLASPTPSPQVASISDRIYEQGVPEPSSVALLLMGSVIALGRRRASGHSAS